MSGRRGGGKTRQQGTGPHVGGGSRVEGRGDRADRGETLERRGRGKCAVVPIVRGTKRHKRKCMSERSGGRPSCRRRELLDCFGGGRMGLIPRVSWPGSDTECPVPASLHV